MYLVKALTLLALSVGSNAHATDWSENATIIPGENRANILDLETSELEAIKERGYIHAMKYPVTVTGLLIPYKPLLNFFKTDDSNPLKKLFMEAGKSYAGFKNEQELYEWLGLSKVNPPGSLGIYKMPYPNGKPDQFYVGAGIIKTSHGEGLTFSCFACHAQTMFGTTVMGLTNKRPHANKFFHMARKVVPKIPTLMFGGATNSTLGEMKMFDRTKKNLVSVSATVPQVLGLDTSLPQVALSLAARNNDELASKNPELERHPRENELATFIADSKPLPWWNLKYKTRWLADGSIVSGNPILTNFLWNEIGRGTDLVELEKWMSENKKTIDELTAAAFATEAPRYTDFFPERTLNIARAKHGEKLFNDTCMKCHGEYKKMWSLPGTESLSVTELSKTIKVIYFDKTPVKDVGTDPQRHQGIKFFAEALNDLKISRWMQTRVEPQVGYVPPPLVGIWARYPYFHNNSIPNLCALLSREQDRPKTWIQGPAINKTTDFDLECNGYPVGSKIPAEWLKDVEAKFDATKPGLTNIGHTKMILNADGTEKYSAEDKKDLIHFLKSL
jgi:hypothetical protein